MGVKLKKIKRQNPQDRNQVKWYLSQQKSGTVNLSAIAKEIADRSSLSFGDVQNVLSNLVEILPLFLKLGQTVRITGFGNFHLSVSSEGVEKAEDLRVKNVKGVKLRFIPSRELKQDLEKITFELVE